MRFDLIPSLATQRELYLQERTPDRFKWYLRQMLAEEGGQEVVLPITAVNPVGREHCLEAVEALISLDAEAVMRAALIEAEHHLRRIKGSAHVCLNLVDDLMGGWTNRIFTEAGLRFGSAPAERANRERRNIIVAAWTSERPTADALRSDTLAACYRRAWWDVSGLPKTLSDLVEQEGNALLFSGAEAVSIPLTPEELENTVVVLDSLGGAEGYSTSIAAMFGDDAAAECGYEALGVPARGGFAAALEQARERGIDPVEVLRQRGTS